MATYCVAVYGVNILKSKNITISLAPDLILASKRYAKSRGTSINELFRQFLEEKVVGKLNGNVADELMLALDEASGSGKANTSIASPNKPIKWTREDAYSR